MTPRATFNIPREDIKKKILSNGMTIIAAKVALVPKVLVQIAYDVGAAVEEQGEKGLAHLVEHMIFKGTSTLQEGAIDAIARKYGAEFNAYTSSDETSYWFEVDRENWKNFIPMFADCMKNVSFDKEHLASEVKAVVQELNMYRDKPVSRMVEIALRLGFPSNHPYHNPVIGFKEDLASVTSDILKKFYKKYYHPERAVLFMVGDLDPADALAYAEGYFADIPNGGSVEFNKFPEVVHDLTINVSRVYEHVQQEQAMFYWVIPGLRSETELIVQAAKSVLGGGEGSRLYKALVDDAKVADDVGVEVYQMMHGGVFLIIVEPKRGKLDECRQIINSELTNLIVNGISDIERQKFVAGYTTNFARSLESLNGLLEAWIPSYFMTRDEHDVFKKLEQCYTVDPKEIVGFVAEYLDPFLMSWAEVMPFVKTKEGFWQRNQAHLKKIEEQILSVHQRTTEIEDPVIPEQYAHPKKLSFTFPRPTSEMVMDNGLQVVMHSDASLPLASMVLQFRNGSYYASSREGRLVGLMMGALIEGSTQFSKQQILDYFEANGVFYRLDGYGMSVSLISTNHIEVFDRALHILFNPKFDARALEHVKQLTIATLERSKDEPSDVAMRLLKNEIYKGTDNDWTADDIIATVKKLTVADVKALHASLIRPEAVVVSFAGQFDEAEVTGLLNKYFGGLSAGKFEPKLIGQSTFVPGAEIDFVMQKDQVFFVMGQPSTVRMLDADYLPLRMLNLIAFYSLGSRLYQLREQTGLFYRASGGMAAGATVAEGGADSVYAILNPNTVADAEVQIRAMFTELAEHGVATEELEATRQLMLKQTIDLISTTQERASLFAGMKVLNLSPDYYDVLIARVNAMTVEELNLVAKKHFDTAKMARIRVGFFGK